MRTTFLFVFAIFGITLQAQDTVSTISDPNAYQRERFADFLHANINLSFIPDSGKVEGQVVHQFIPLRKSIDTLYLDGVKMKNVRASWQENPIDVRVYEKGITLVFPEPLLRGDTHRVAIEYEAYPSRGLYFIGWDDPSGRSRKQIWTQGQGIDNRHWLPLFDDMLDKITTDLLVTIDSNFEVLSNGNRVMTIADPGGKTLNHFQMTKPHSPYLIMLGIGEYIIAEENSSSGIPMKTYMYPEWPNRTKWTYKHNKEIFDFLESEIGLAYPWESYSQIPVQDFPYGAMENTTATVFGDFYCVDSLSFNDANYIYVNGHELAHQWFGDWVTSKSPKHHWLHESFATYYHHLVVKEFVGEEEWSRMMRDNQNAALNGSKGDMKGVGHSQAGSHRHYLKGSYVLRMLRYVLGDEDFKIGLQYYLNKHEMGNANTEDLISAFSESTGHSIGWFIDQWIYRGGEPHYRVSFQDDKKAGVFRFTVSQYQDSSSFWPVFLMPVVLQVHLKDGSAVSERVWVENRRDTFELARPKKSKVDYVLFDPGSEILKEIAFDKPVEWWINQALNSEKMIDRYDAVEALKVFGKKETEETLRAVMNNESEFHMVRGSALKQIIAFNSLRNEEVMAIVSGGDIQLQKTLLGSVKSMPDGVMKSYESLLSSASYDLIQLTLLRLCLSYKENAARYLEETKNIYGTRGNNVRIQWLEIKYSVDKDDKALEELIDMTSNSYDFITRQKAMGVIKRLNVCNAELIFNLSQGVLKANWKLASTSGRLISHFYAQAEFKTMVEQTVLNFPASDAKRERIKRFLK